MSEGKPLHLLAGGRSAVPGANESLIREVFRATGMKAPSIGYVGTASGDGEDFFRRMAGMLGENGAGEVAHALLTPPDADIAGAKSILARADMICIGGGDVETGMRILNDRRMAGFLAGLYRGGKPFFGLSAGSIMLAEKWVRWCDPHDDATAEIFPCMGLAPVLCDTHDEQGDWEELKVLLALQQEGVTGYGIVTGTALRVSPGGRVEALGGAVHRYVRRDGEVKRMPDLMP
ncbi:MAG: Type 1 glutamine amidotransferase-like domain-containing protein [Thermodesulfobacteriota bacterium]